jgi:hypothetical protein
MPTPIFVGDAEPAWATVIEGRSPRARSRRATTPSRPPQTGVITARDIYKGKGLQPISLSAVLARLPLRLRLLRRDRYFDKKHYLRAHRRDAAGGRDRRSSLLFFVDDNIAPNRVALKELCRALIPDAGQLGQPGLARRHLRPRGDAS